MRPHDDLFVRKFAQKVGWKQVGTELRLAHTGRNVDDYTVFAPVYDVVEDFAERTVVSALFEPRIDGVCEAYD